LPFPAKFDISDIKPTEAPMGDLLIRNIPEAMKTDLSEIANLTGSNLTETAKLALREGIEATKKRLESEADERPLGDRLREIFAGVFDTNQEAEEFHREIERERKSDFGRPLPNFE
jgi:hypothetical protein